MQGRMRAWLVAMAIGWVPMASIDAAEPELATASRGGVLRLTPNAELFDHLGVQVEPKRSLREMWELVLAPRQPVQVELGDGAPTKLIAGELALTGLRLRRVDGVLGPALRMTPDPGRQLGWRVVDADGEVWLRIGHGMRSPNRVRDGLRLITTDLRIGPALAAWVGMPVRDRLLANVEVQLPLDLVPNKATEKSCAVPNWPGSAGYVTDIELFDISDPNHVAGVDVQRCRRSTGSNGCDGPGGDAGEVVIVPSTWLRNRDEANVTDVPWYTKFSGDRPPYGNDQHPFLVWNLYRLDANGRIEQIARSGLKHAFATANFACQDATCLANGNILGRACEDPYNAGSNDLGFFLSPRSEVIPAQGVWGRCGSVFDDIDNNGEDALVGCDGVQDAPPDDGYRERLVARESDIDPVANAGAQYLIDAWYVVRDDENLFNTMGYRSLAPQFASNLWNAGPLGAFRQGAVIDRWLELAPSGGETLRSEIVGIEGQVGVAARVSRLPGGDYRYDYAVMNFDFSRAVTDPATTEPNLRILRNLGLSAFELELANGATVVAAEFRDGDAVAANDWLASGVANAQRWNAPVAATLDWGRMVFVSVVSASAPGRGELRLDVAEIGTPASYVAQTLVPDGAQVFRNSFE